MTIIEAILKINPDAQVSVGGNSFDDITWHNGTTPISQSEIEAKITELEAEYIANQYQRDRKYEYPNIGDQLDDLFKAGAFSTEMTAAIQAVKDKYPKE